ncbi:hypothetical protein D918_07928, partial [Trichuris suis]
MSSLLYVTKSMRNITDFFCITKFGGYPRCLLNQILRTFEAVLPFFADEDVALRDILQLRKVDIACLADLCGKFKSMKLQLQ